MQNCNHQRETNSVAPNCLIRIDSVDHFITTPEKVLYSSSPIIIDNNSITNNTTTTSHLPQQQQLLPKSRQQQQQQCEIEKVVFAQSPKSITLLPNTLTVETICSTTTTDSHIIMNRHHETINDTDNIHPEQNDDDPKEPPTLPSKSSGREGVGSGEFSVSGERRSCFLINVKEKGNSHPHKTKKRICYTFHYVY